MSTTLEHLKTVLHREYKLAPECLTLDAPLEGLGIDSLGAVELLWNLEEALGIKLPAEAVTLHTLGDVVAFLDELVAHQGARQVAAAPVA
jgi:acyl carrier protein